jgi:GT2 family glycosyltransferase
MKSDMPNILCVVVLYELPLTSVASWRALNEWLTNEHGLNYFHILVYDNSAEAKLDINSSLPNFSYFHNHLNGGTAAAYSFAADFAASNKCEWLLLLDQDTLLPPTYIASIVTKLAEPNQDLDALVPWVRHANTLISPSKLNALGSIKPTDNLTAESRLERLTAIASGLVIKTETLLKILPLHKDLWLDYVDHWIFLKLSNLGGRVQVLNECIQHELSIRNVSKLSKARLKSILNGESAFYTELGGMAAVMYPARLFCRALVYLVNNPKLAPVVLRRLFSRHHK